MGLPWIDFFCRCNVDKEESDSRKLLSQIPFFANLNRRELAVIEQFLHQREFQCGEYIFRQGDRGLGMYIIQNGLISVVSEPENYELSELRDGDFFGEMTLLDDLYRSATIRAKSECCLFGLFQPDLTALIDRDQSLGLKIVMQIAKYACQRLRVTNDKVIALSAELAKLKKSFQNSGE